MNAHEYLSARAAYVLLNTAIEACIGDGPLDPADEADLIAAASAEERALRTIASAPASSPAEIEQRAAILSLLVDEGLWEDHVPALAARVAADLRSIAA